LEHLDDPGIVFSELARILKPSGKLIVLTPSKYHYVALLSRLTPHWVHEMVSIIRGNSTQDAFPTKYLANSKAELIHYAEEAGLTLKEFIAREVCPNYLLWSLPSFLLSVAYERVVNHFDIMSPFRVSIIAVFER
jgi:ubiquinone/menaquinone biosynthesis C-methylase UbiE